MKDGTSSSSQSRDPQRTHSHGRWIALLSIAGLVLSSCVASQFVVLQPPQVPGAEFVGTESCADCHGDLVESFAGAAHAQLAGDSLGFAGNLGCEACHGPGSAHVDDGGESRSIVNPGRGAQVCAQCHLDVASDFALPHSHPVAGGDMACVDCHNPHEGHEAAFFAGNFGHAAGAADCLECHQAQRGPFAFEHEALRDGCTACHQPHGAIHDKMLLSRGPDLCLNCHFQQPTRDNQLLIGRVDHRVFVSQGTCWTAGCHEAVHGSHVNSHLRY